MEENIRTLKKCPLFANIKDSDMKVLLQCLNAQEKHLAKGELLFSRGSILTHPGIVLSGNIHIVQEDYWGNHTILTSIQAGDLFGESFACANKAPLCICASAAVDSTILLVDYSRILTTCASACEFHTTLIQNLIQILANKNINLTQKIEHITKKTTRGKVLSYLSECVAASGKNVFEIPFNRQELADFLSVERSALSNTLCKMRDRGEIKFHKNKFTLLAPNAFCVHPKPSQKR